MITRKAVGGKAWNNLSHRRKIMARKNNVLLMTMKWGGGL